MQKLTVERICVLDVACATCLKTREFLRHTRLATILHEDNALAVKAIAKKLKVAVEEFFTYVWLKTYLAEMSGSFEDVPPLAVVAQHLGISLEEMDVYLQNQSEIHDNELDYLDDLQEDAGLCGD